MTHEQAKLKISAFLGGPMQLVEYVNTNSQSTKDSKPEKIGEVLGDYRPYGAIRVVGYEGGKFYDEDGEPMRAAPNAWAPIPKGAIA